MSKDNTLNALRQSEEKRTRFLNAWKRGADFLGAEYFGPKKPNDAHDKNDLLPQARAIEADFDLKSTGEKQFISGMVSFYDPTWGEELAARTDSEKSLCGLVFNLDHEETEILCELLLNYEGWEKPWQTQTTSQPCPFWSVSENTENADLQ